MTTKQWLQINDYKTMITKQWLQNSIQKQLPYSPTYQQAMFYNLVNYFFASQVLGQIVAPGLLDKPLFTHPRIQTL